MKRTMGQRILRGLVNDLARVELIAPHPYAECASRLAQRTNSVWNIFGSHPVTCTVVETGFILRSTRSRSFRSSQNPFNTVVRGAAVEEGGQTRLRCRSGIAPFAFFLMAFWFSAMLLIATTTLAVSIVAAIHGQSNVKLLSDGILGPLVGIGGGIITVAFGRFLARGDRRFLVDFLIATLDAREVPPSGEDRLDFWVVAGRWLDPFA